MASCAVGEMQGITGCPDGGEEVLWFCNHGSRAYLITTLSLYRLIVPPDAILFAICLSRTMAQKHSSLKRKKMWQSLQHTTTVNIQLIINS